jgi:hypothetical protein
MAAIEIPFSTANNRPDGTNAAGIPRFHLRLRRTISLSGVDIKGKSFVENVNTVLITPTGGTVECSRSLAPDQEVALRAGSREVLGRVVGQTGISEKCHLYGIAFLQEDSSFWGVHFPAVHEDEKRIITALLECCRCGLSRQYVLNEIEVVVLETSRKVGLACPKCNDSTLWRVASVSSTQRAPSSDSQTPTLTEEQRVDAALDGAVMIPRPPARVVNKRKHVRIGISRAKACIQRPEAHDQTVELINVSRGGACFRTEAVLPLGTWVRIAAPFTVGSSNIFVAARIVRIGKEDEWTREYGVEYPVVH